MRKSTIADLRQLFERSIPASSIAEPLASLDSETPAQTVLEFMDSAGFDVLGIRYAGLTVAYVFKHELHEDVTAGCAARSITPELSILENGSLLRVLREVSDRGYVFVSSLGQATGIVTRADLAKAPVRMWLFNLVTLLEMRMLLAIREHLCEEEWLSLLKESRVASAKSLLIVREARNEDIDLADCLQFSDKKEVSVHCPALRQLFGSSKKDVQNFLESCERLRNDLAHAQDIASGRWPDILSLAERIESTLTRLDGTGEQAV